MAQKRDTVVGGPSLVEALARATPEAAVSGAASRFWGGLVTGLGKDAYVSHTTKRGRRVLRKERRAFGLSRVVDRSGPEVVTESGLRVARWELVPLFIMGAATAAIAASNTEKGQALKGKVKVPQLWYGYTKGPLGITIANFRGGIHIPV